MTGELILVSTPIGNLADLSPRAAAALADADVVCCEDTRHTGLALSRLGIAAKRLLSLHAHNEAARVPGLVADLVAGGRIAVVSDAGTPAVSDPGELLVDAAIAAGVRVTAVPGPSAVLAAIVIAGFGVRRFGYEGFLPRKGRERRERLEHVAQADAPTVIFEAPRRVGATLGDLATACGSERLVAVCRELTKVHEEVWRAGLGAAAERVSGTEPRGEFVLVVAPRPSGETGEMPAPLELRHKVEGLVAAGHTRRDAVDAVAQSFGLPRRRVYEAALEGLGKGGDRADR